MAELDDTFRLWFWSQVEKTAQSCWLWTGNVNDQGYGELYNPQDGKRISAQRMAWILANGPIVQASKDPKDWVLVCHKCDFPICVNPAHHFLGTHQRNSDDMKNKGRSRVHVEEWGENNPDKLAWIGRYLSGK